MQYLIADMRIRGLIDIEKPVEKEGDLFLKRLTVREKLRLSMQYDIDWSWLRYYNKFEGTAPTHSELGTLARIDYKAH